MNTDKSILIEKSRQYAHAVLNGEFDIITANMNDVMAPQLNASVLRQSWDSVTKELSACQGIMSADYMEIQGIDFVMVMLDYTSSRLRVAFGYDNDGKISRLSVNRTTRSTGGFLAL